MCEVKTSWNFTLFTRQILTTLCYTFHPFRFLQFTRLLFNSQCFSGNFPFWLDVLVNKKLYDQSPQTHILSQNFKLVVFTVVVSIYEKIFRCSWKYLLLVVPNVTRKYLLNCYVSKSSFRCQMVDVSTFCRM